MEYICVLGRIRTHAGRALMFRNPTLRPLGHPSLVVVVVGVVGIVGVTNRVPTQNLRTVVGIDLLFF